MRRQILYYGVNDQSLYGSDQNLIGDSNSPYIRYREKMQIELHYVSETINFTPYTGFSGVVIASSAAIDNDWVHYLEGSLTGPKSGAITSIVISGLSGEPPASGYVRLTNGSGQTESVAYSGISLVGDAYVLAVSVTLTNSYILNDEALIYDKLIIKADSVDDSGKDTGVFIITLSANNQSFFKAINGVDSISGCIFEHKVLDNEEPPNLIFVSQFGFNCKNIVDDGGSSVPPAPSADYYTKTEVLTRIADFVTETGLAAEYAPIAASYLKADTYTKTEVDAILADIYIKSETYSQGEVDVAIAAAKHANVIAFTPPTGMTSTDVQSAVNEVNGKVGSIVASGIPFTPPSGMVAVNIQTAINELKTNKVELITSGNTGGGTNSTAIGGEDNVSSGNDSSIIGGAGNNATAQASIVLGGISNSASEFQSVVIGGESNIASGQDSVVIGGESNIASGVSSSVIGGSSCRAEANQSIATGESSKAVHRGSIVNANGYFNSIGDCQNVRFQIRGTTTDATQTELILPTRFTIQDNCVYACTITIVGRKSDGSQHAMYKRMALVKRVSNTVALVGSVQVIGVDIESTPSAWTILMAVDDTNKALIVKVTGVAATTIRWSALIEAVQITNS